MPTSRTEDCNIYIEETAKDELKDDIDEFEELYDEIEEIYNSYMD